MASSRGSIAGLRHWTLANLRVKVKPPTVAQRFRGLFSICTDFRLVAWTSCDNVPTRSLYFNRAG